MAAKSLARAVCSLALFALVARGGGAGVPRAAASPSSLIVFGDSLSDIGNIDDATFGFVPGSSYYNGRFSNGPVWVESLAVDLGLAPLLPSTSGGSDYAYGGAQTSGGGLFIRNVDEQLTLYLGPGAADPAALYIMFAGANDLFNGETNVSAPIARIAAALNRLIAAGARQFVVPNLPLLGKTPRYNRDPSLSAQFDARTQQYNAQFEATIESLATTHLHAAFYRFDVAELFSAVIDEPAAWGLANATDPAAPGLVPGALFYNRNRIVPHPEQYLFWDELHPTTTVHGLLADYASRLLTGIAGDFDADGEVDAADLGLLQAGFGVAAAVRRQGDADGDGDADGADLLTWQRQLGSTIYAPPSQLASTAAPEPSATILAAMAAFAPRLLRPHGARTR